MLCAATDQGCVVFEQSQSSRQEKWMVSSLPADRTM